MEKKIKKRFSSTPMPKHPAQRIYYPVNDNDKMIVAIEKDPEQPIVLCHLYQKREATADADKNSEAYLRGSYIDDLISTMLNDRYAELRQQAGSPVQSASGRASTFFISRTKEAFAMSISCKQDNILGGIIAAVGIAEQARQHGFTQSELDRAKKLFLNAAERRYNMRNDYRNSHYVNHCVSNFLTGEPLVSVEYELDNTRHLDREVTLDQVNAAVKELITDQNQVVVMYAPDKEEVILPSEEQVEQVILAAQRLSYAPYTEQVLSDQLIGQLPNPAPSLTRRLISMALPSTRCPMA
jgi:zinc protease